MIPSPEVFVLYSGSAETFQHYEAELTALATPRYLGPDPGLAALYDFALLSGMSGLLGGLLQALAIADTEGGRVEDFTETFLVPWLQAMLGVFPETARQVDSGDYSTTGATLRAQTAGLNLADFASRIAIPAALIAPLEDLTRRRVAEGHGDDDFMSVFELVRHPSRRMPR